MDKEVVIVIAEDDEGHALLIKKNLRRAGISNKILHFKDGQETLNFFLRKGKSEIEEERRLFYVGTTRAIQQLIISDGSIKQSQFLTGINPSFFQTVYSIGEVVNHLSEKRKNQKQIYNEQFLEHPIFGKGRIVKKMPGKTYLIDFAEKGEKLIDTSLVKVNFLK